MDHRFDVQRAPDCGPWNIAELSNQSEMLSRGTIMPRPPRRPVTECEIPRLVYVALQVLTPSHQAIADSAIPSRTLDEAIAPWAQTDPVLSRVY